MPISHVLWRCVEGKSLPVRVGLGASCRRCGARIEVSVEIWSMDTKPDHLRGYVCRAAEIQVRSARAEPLKE